MSVSVAWPRALRCPRVTPSGSMATRRVPWAARGVERPGPPRGAHRQRYCDAIVFVHDIEDANRSGGVARRAGITLEVVALHAAGRPWSSGHGWDTPWEAPGGCATWRPRSRRLRPWRPERLASHRWCPRDEGG